MPIDDLMIELLSLSMVELHQHHHHYQLQLLLSCLIVDLVQKEFGKLVLGKRLECLRDRLTNMI